MQETIDVTPKWTAVVRIMTQVLMNPKSGHEAKCNAVTELLNLAKIVDDQNEKAGHNCLIEGLDHDSK